MLAHMQKDFRHWLVHAENGALAAALDSPRGLAAYQNNYRSQLVGVLQASYPQLRARLGDDAFRELAIHHVERHPPSSWTLDAYGADLGDTLGAMYPRHPDLGELAWIEWTLSEVFVAPDAPTLDPRELEGIDWDSARLRLSPSLRLRAVATNAIELWPALQQGSVIPEAEMLATPACAVIWRQGFASRLRAADVTEHAAWLSLRDDARFSTLCDALVEHLGEDEGIARAGSLLADWIASGIVVAVDAGD